MDVSLHAPFGTPWRRTARRARHQERKDRKSTRLNSSQLVISYAVFCLTKNNRVRYASDCRDAGNAAIRGRTLMHRYQRDTVPAVGYREPGRERSTARARTARRERRDTP